MERIGRKFLVLYLTDWQIRLLKDTLGVHQNHLTIPLEENAVVRYGVGLPKRSDIERMYLTDWQKREIMDEAGESCDYIELENAIVTKYGVQCDIDVGIQIKK